MMIAEAHSLAQSLRIETLDRSGRWYLTPGSRCIYDLRVRNDTKNAADCSLVVEDPASGVTVDPQTFTSARPRSENGHSTILRKRHSDACATRLHDVA